MKLPWKSKKELKQRVEDLESSLEQLEEEKEKWRERFEAEEKRRSELSRKKQEAEEQLNRLEQKIKSEPVQEKEDSDYESKEEFRKLELDEFRSVLQRLDSVESRDEKLVSVYCPGELEQLSDLRALKNAVSSERYSELSGLDSFLCFLDPVLGAFVFKLAPFFSEKVSVSQNFEAEEILELIEREKHWCMVSAGETEIYREKNGEYELVERVKSRVDREHSKGGFSQDRFERKRDEQISSHLEEVEKKLEEFDELFLLGNQKLCDDLPGVYLGGFDPNRGKPEQFYRCRIGVFF